MQTQQLIAGGRQPDLRVPETLTALDRLEARGWISPPTAAEMAEAYRFLRGLPLISGDDLHPEGIR